MKYTVQEDLHIPSLREGYQAIVDRVLKYGERCAPRGEPTVEWLGGRFILDDPTDSLINVRGRQANLSIGAAEALQLVGGFSDPALMTRIAKSFSRYMNDDDLNGAYGPRVRDQLIWIEELFKRDPETRQAILMIAHPDLDPVDAGKDFACTVFMHFMIRGGKLRCSTSMRSNDLYLGLSYDITQFTTLQCSLANALGIEPGPYLHQANSLHMYERDFDKINKLGDAKDSPKLFGFGYLGQPIGEIMMRARALYEGKLDDPTATEQWFVMSLAPFLQNEIAPNSRRLSYREIFFAHNGIGPYVCAWCGYEVTAEDVTIHHADHNRQNSSPTNLLAVHAECHAQHHRHIEPPRSPEVRAAISAKMKGRSLTPKHLEKLRIANRTKIICECGRVTARATASRHERATGHRRLDVEITPAELTTYEHRISELLPEIKSQLKARGILQDSIREILSCRQPAVSRYLSGEWKCPIHVAKVLADLSGVDISSALPAAVLELDFSDSSAWSVGGWGTGEAPQAILERRIGEVQDV